MIPMPEDVGTERVPYETQLIDLLPDRDVCALISEYAQPLYTVTICSETDACAEDVRLACEPTMRGQGCRYFEPGRERATQLSVLRNHRNEVVACQPFDDETWRGHYSTPIWVCVQPRLFTGNECRLFRALYCAIERFLVRGDTLTVFPHIMWKSGKGTVGEFCKGFFTDMGFTVVDPTWPIQARLTIE